MWKGTLRCHDAGDNENVKKAIGWISQTTFLYISLLSLHDYDGKMTNFRFYGGCKQATAKFSFSFSTWIWLLGIRLKKSSGRNRDEIEKNANSLFKRRFRGLRRRGILNSLISRIAYWNPMRRKLIFRSEDWDLERQTFSANRSGTMCVNDLFQFNAVTVHTIADGFPCRYKESSGIV